MIHTEAAPEKVVSVFARLFERVPSGDPIEALLAAMVQHLVAQRGRGDPMLNEISTSKVAGCSGPRTPCRPSG